MQPPAKKLHLEFGGYTTAGKKKENEDAFSALLPQQSTVRQLKGAVACIADGASCSEEAELASQTCVTNFVTDYYSTPDSWKVKTSAVRVISALNSWLHHNGQQLNNKQNKLLTTFSCVVIKSHTAHIFHIGDSRIYLLRDQHLEQLTRDHFQRQNDNTGYLTRAMGVEHKLDVDYRQEAIKKGDKLILTTDGIHDFIDGKQLKELLLKKYDSLEKTAKLITEEALKNGSDDNLSCLIVDVTALPIERLEEAHRKLTKLKIPPVMKTGVKIDHFEILEIIHHGVRSHVYRAKNLQDQKQYILKAPSESFAEDAQYLEGFIREQWVGRRIEHKQIMRIYPHPENSPFLYHICEYIEGQSLRQWIIDNPNPTLERIRSILKSLIAALRAMHRAEMIHRDLKPENIIISKNDQVKIIDFGTVHVAGLDEIASPLREDCPVGSVDYIAPEFLLGSKGGNRSDIFSLGCIIYEMLTGKLPFNMPDNFRYEHTRYAKSFDNWHYQPINLHRDDLPYWVDNVLRKSTMADPRFRYSALSELLSDMISPNKKILQQYKDTPLIEKNPIMFWQVLSAILFILVLLQWYWLLKP